MLKEEGGLKQMVDGTFSVSVALKRVSPMKDTRLAFPYPEASLLTSNKNFQKTKKSANICLFHASYYTHTAANICISKVQKCFVDIP